jgi:hypothetical protein
MKTKKLLTAMENIANWFEIVIAVLLFAVIAIRGGEIILAIAGRPDTLLHMEFERILSVAFSLVIGVELTKMLCKHTPESVIDVLLFAIARQTIIYQNGAVDMLLGIAAISALFAAKRYLIHKSAEEETTGR